MYFQPFFNVRFGLDAAVGGNRAYACSLSLAMPMSIPARVSACPRMWAISIAPPGSELLAADGRADRPEHLTVFDAQFLDQIHKRVVNRFLAPLRRSTAKTSRACFKEDSAISALVFIFLCVYMAMSYSGRTSKKSTISSISLSVETRGLQDLADLNEIKFALNGVFQMLAAPVHGNCSNDSLRMYMPFIHVSFSMSKIAGDLLMRSTEGFLQFVQRIDFLFRFRRPAQRRDVVEMAAGR